MFDAYEFCLSRCELFVGSIAQIAGSMGVDMCKFNKYKYFVLY